MPLPTLNTSPGISNALSEAYRLQHWQKDDELRKIQIEEIQRKRNKEDEVKTALTGFVPGAEGQENMLGKLIQADPHIGMILAASERGIKREKTEEERLKKKEKTEDEDRARKLQIEKLNMAGKLLGSVTDQQGWAGALYAYSSIYGDEELKGFPLTYNPETVKQLRDQTLSAKEKIILERLEKGDWSEVKEGTDYTGKPIFYQVNMQSEETRILKNIAPKHENLSTDQLESKTWQSILGNPKSATKEQILFLSTRLKSSTEKATKTTMTENDKAIIDIKKEQAKKEIDLIDAYRQGKTDPITQKKITPEIASAAMSRIMKLQTEINSIGTTPTAGGGTPPLQNLLPAPAAGAAAPGQAPAAQAPVDSAATPQPAIEAPGAAKTPVAGGQFRKLVDIHSKLTQEGKDPMALPAIKKATETFFGMHPELRAQFDSTMKTAGKKATGGFKTATLGEAISDVGSKAAAVQGEEKARQIIEGYRQEWVKGSQPPSFDKFVSDLKAAGAFAKENLSSLKGLYDAFINLKVPYIVEE